LPKLSRWRWPERRWSLTWKREPRKARGQYIDDAATTTKVKAALVQDQSLDGLQIDVET
jgi:osmotically-inducible protein OsmY